MVYERREIVTNSVYIKKIAVEEVIFKMDLKAEFRISTGREDLSNALGRIIWPQCVGWINVNRKRQDMSGAYNSPTREYERCELGWQQ